MGQIEISTLEVKLRISLISTGRHSLTLFIT